MEDEIPWFDPDDGGVHTRILLVFQMPGPKAVLSGFISAETPDQTARNMWELRTGAEIERHHILHWNIVPWYLKDG